MQNDTVPIDRTRVAGEAFNSTEQALLTMLCAGESAASHDARAQLSTASWGGYEHEGCACFLVQSSTAAAATPIHHDGGPFETLVVERDGAALGLIELWVVNGLLHSVNYTPFVDEHTEFPALEHVQLSRASRTAPAWP